MPWTDRYIKGLQAKPAPYRVYEKSTDPGFCIQVMPTGVKTFEQQYTNADGKRRWLRLGRYPDTPLARARELAREARAELAKGIDPKNRENDAPIYGTVSQLADAYMQHLATKGAKRSDYVRRLFDVDVLPKFGNLPANAVKPSHVRDIMRAAIQRGSRTYANRIHQALHAAFVYGRRHDNNPNASADVLFGIADNPAAAVPRDAAAERALDRALTWAELRRVWHDELLPPHGRLAVRLILALGGQRPGEITGAAWNEFDIAGALWVLPPERSKNGREHALPLNPLALETLAEIREIFPRSTVLFPHRNGATAVQDVPWSATTLPHIIKKYISKCAADGLAWNASWTPRDLRRTVKTRLGELGVAKDWRDRLQNHAQSDVSTKHYDRYDYMNEKRHALNVWESKLLEVINDGDGNANVVAFAIK